MAGEYYYDTEHYVQVDHRFQGTFDGAGNTLTIGYGTSENRFNEQYAAPFRFVKGATIQNLHVAGNIYISNQCAAGIVGNVSESPLTLSNCRCSVNINCNYQYSGQHAGVIARIDHNTNGSQITGCLFDGSLTTTSTTESCATFFGVAGGSITLTDCVVKPSSVSAGMLSNTFGYSESATFNNCYYVPVENLPTNQGTAAHAISKGTNVSSIDINGTPTEYNVSGIKVYGDNKGLMIGDVVYAAENNEVDLTLATGQTGYTNTYTASAGTLNKTDNTHATLTMPNEDVTISAVFTTNASYIDADGVEQTHADTRVLTENDVTLTSGWYITGITSSLNTYNRIIISGNVNLILADNKQLFANSGIYVPSGSNLSIYGQSHGTGQLRAYLDNKDMATIGGGYTGSANNDAGTINFFGGSTYITQSNSSGYGIGAGSGSTTATINLSMNQTYEYFNTTNFNGMVIAVKGVSAENDMSVIYKGVLTDAQKAALSDKNIRKNIKYAISFAVDTEDIDHWTDPTPNPAAAGQKVSVRYGAGTKFVKSVKAVRDWDVDLGLTSGTRWATKNVGATSETDYGLMFSWGDTQGYSSSDATDHTFDWANYKWNPTGDGSTFTRYTGSDFTKLKYEDDAARTSWGGDWRMPTEDDFAELINGTDQVWVTNYNGSGINGWIFSNKTDASKYIFLPAAGVRYNSELSQQGVEGFYWSSSYPDGTPAQQGNALYLHYDSIYRIASQRCYGTPIRPVYKIVIK